MTLEEGKEGRGRSLSCVAFRNCVYRMHFEIFLDSIHLCHPFPHWLTNLTPRMSRHRDPKHLRVDRISGALVVSLSRSRYRQTDWDGGGWDKKARIIKLEESRLSISIIMHRWQKKIFRAANSDIWITKWSKVLTLIFNRILSFHKLKIPGDAKSCCRLILILHQYSTFVHPYTVS